MINQEFPVAQRAALQLLLDDHRNLKQTFKDFSREKDASVRQVLAHEACMELMLHATLEEQLFYPYLRAQQPAAFGHLLNEALVEHRTIRDLVSRLQEMNSDDMLFDATVTVLGQYVSHHIDEEESELFPKVIVMNVDLRPVAERMAQRKQDLRVEAHAA
jgi:hemerythrin-like domain-containing protein